MGVRFVTLTGVAPPPLPCRASPPQRGRSICRARPFHRQGAIHLPISPLEGEMPGRAEGGISCSKASTPC
ncbi:propionyl-coenzyme A carboxylase alpha polypeptide [Agrobacterium sp. ICMP 6402]|nr:propionyl-coenzyme A carboxylase alpha polypeptide [Agrobacterium sp. ICMP 6402]